MSWKYQYHKPAAPDVVPVVVGIDFPGEMAARVQDSILNLEQVLGIRLFLHLHGLSQDPVAAPVLNAEGMVTNKGIVYLAFDVPKAEYNALVSEDTSAVALEREACAKIAQGAGELMTVPTAIAATPFYEGYRRACEDVAAAIRRRTP